ncbi:VRR-NUC domain-containing protein [Deinococcus alpinitundrae]|uniref:VRR-NUC domain-containing protein n=1 Tax=Deinococcus alpinitundrae TaxID=468913 RepID=UPI00137B123D|nr:VRR-NUC domain-containing protein [Deinococcus alpinitundrae]
MSRARFQKVSKVDGGLLESTIQAQIVQALKLTGWTVMEALKGSARGGVVYSTPGIPDLIAVKSGRVVFLEVKRPKTGKLSLSQRTLHAELTSAGAALYVVTSAEEALRAALAG